MYALCIYCCVAGPPALTHRRHTLAPPARPHTQEDDDGGGERVPGTGAIWLKTFGCAHNTSDGEYMAGMLVEYGYR